MNKEPEFCNAEREISNTRQKIFDDFNGFIFSEDSRVFNKLIARTVLFNKVIDIPGDIVECGVFKGSGMFTWLKLKRALAPNSFKKIIGFDIFDSEELVDSLSGIDKETMGELFRNRKFKLDYDYYDILNMMIKDAGFLESDYELICGDISKTAQDMVNKRPGFKISLLYLDLDLEKPTYEALSALWPRVAKGGIVVFDEYAYHQWSESLGVDKFVEENNLQVKLLNFNAPTAYIQK